MAQFKVGQTVKVQGFKKPGTVITLNSDGTPQTVDIGGEIIEVTNLIVKAIGIVKAIWLIVKSIFSKNG